MNGHPRVGRGRREDGSIGWGVADDVGPGFGGEIGAGAAAGRGVPRPASARGGAVALGVHRPASRSGRPDPRGLPGDGDDGGYRAGRRLAGDRRRGRGIRRRAGAVASGPAGRLPDHPRGGPGRDGRGVRGRADLARPPRGAEDPVAAGRGGIDPSPAVLVRGAGRGAAAPRQHRAGLWRGRAGRRALLRHAVHPGPWAGPRLRRVACRGGRSGHDGPLPVGDREPPGRDPHRCRRHGVGPRPLGRPGCRGGEPARTGPGDGGGRGRGDGRGRVGGLGIRRSAARDDGRPVVGTPETGLFPIGGPRRPRRRRGPGLRPLPGHPPPRHQAIEPAARRRRHRLDHRLRPGHRRGRRRAHRDRQPGGHAALHGPGAVRGVVRPQERRLCAGRDALRALDPPPDLRRAEPGSADEDGGPRGARAAAPDRPGDPAGPGDGRLEGDRQGAGASLRVGRAHGRGPAALPRGASDPGAADRAGRAGVAMEPAQPDPGGVAGRAVPDPVGRQRGDDRALAAGRGPEVAGRRPAQAVRAAADGRRGEPVGCRSPPRPGRGQLRQGPRRRRRAVDPRQREPAPRRAGPPAVAERAAALGAVLLRGLRPAAGRRPDAQGGPGRRRAPAGHHPARIRRGSPVGRDPAQGDGLARGGAARSARRTRPPRRHGPVLHEPGQAGPRRRPQDAGRPGPPTLRAGHRAVARPDPGGSRPGRLQGRTGRRLYPARRTPRQQRPDGRDPGRRAAGPRPAGAARRGPPGRSLGPARPGHEPEQPRRPAPAGRHREPRSAADLPPCGRS